MNPRRLVPDWFEMPGRVKMDDLILIPVTSHYWLQDHDAVVSTFDYLHGGGMNPGMAVQKDVATSTKFGWMDACWLERQWKQKTAVCYGLLTEDESKELGCLYIFPSHKKSYDADVFAWVRDEERQLGLCEKLYQFAEDWIPKHWPLLNTSWPGRKISWADWYELPEKDPQPFPGSHAYVTCPQPLVPNSFTVPTFVQSERFIVVPLNLTMEAITMDHKFCASMKANDLNPSVLNSKNSEVKTLLDTIIEISAIEMDWYVHSEFVYSIRTIDEHKQVGRIFVQPSRKKTYDAEIHIWVESGEKERELVDELNKFTHQWIYEGWPFQKAAWPGRDMACFA
jgi:hypothetical protein